MIPKVVVVGAGPGGLAVARTLNGRAHVTIIDTKSYHELNSGTLQMLVRPASIGKALFDYSRISDIGTLVAGRVEAVAEDHVQLKGGEMLSFDYLVLAPGSTYADNRIKEVTGSAAERQSLIEAEHERLLAADSVLIIGGGIVGVELAGEAVISLPPGKRITLVTSCDRLIADKPPSIGRRAQEWLEKRGVKVLTNTRAVRMPDSSYQTPAGEQLDGEAAYMTVGGKPNTAFLAGSSIPLDAKGHIQVDGFLRVRGRERIFAVGDATDVKETKLGYLAAAQGRLAAGNILAHVAAGSSPPPHAAPLSSSQLAASMLCPKSVAAAAAQAPNPFIATASSAALPCSGGATANKDIPAACSETAAAAAASAHASPCIVHGAGSAASEQAAVPEETVDASATAAAALQMTAWAPFGGFEFVTGQAMLFTLGRNDGVAQGWFAAWLRAMGPDGWFPAWLKAKDLYTSRTRKELGLSDQLATSSVGGAIPLQQQAATAVSLTVGV